jgi:antitoxin component of RelBE/YafQ-DinJ toxin-antitoxin module
MLSKSDFLKYLQCEKYLWLYKHRKDLLEEVSEAQQAIFDQGFNVEEYALKLFPNANSQMEAHAPFAGKPMQLYARADIVFLNPQTNLYDIYEVKSTSEVKAEHLPDLAFQKITFEAAGYKVGKTYLIHLNSKYIRQGVIDPQKLLTVEDVSADVETAIKKITPFIPLALDLSSAIKVYLKQIIIYKGIPLQLLTENGLTEAQEDAILKASEEAKQGKNVVVTNNWKETKAYLDKLKKKS